MRDRALASPTLLGLVGGALGASVGAALARRARAHQYSWPGRRLREGAFDEDYRSRRRVAHAGVGDVRLEPYGGGEDVTYGSYGPDEPLVSASPDEPGEWSRQTMMPEDETGVGERLADKGRELTERTRGAVEQVTERVKDKVPSRDDLRRGAGAVKEKAGQLKDTAGRRARDVGERVRERAVDVGHRARDVAREQPLLVALGAITLGSLAALLIPVTNRERRAFRPMQEKAKEKVQEVASKLETTIRGDEPEQRSGERGQSTSAPPPGEQPRGVIGSPTDVTAKPLEEQKPEQRLGDVPLPDPDLPSIH